MMLLHFLMASAASAAALPSSITPLPPGHGNGLTLANFNIRPFINSNLSLTI
jgi:hypothetical protein